MDFMITIFSYSSYPNKLSIFFILLINLYGGMSCLKNNLLKTRHFLSLRFPGHLRQSIPILVPSCFNYINVHANLCLIKHRVTGNQRKEKLFIYHSMYFLTRPYSYVYIFHFYPRFLCRRNNLLEVWDWHQHKGVMSFHSRHRQLLGAWFA